VKHPRDHRQMAAPPADRAPCGALVCRPGRAWPFWASPARSPFSHLGGLVNRSKRWVLRAPSNGVGRARTVMPHGGRDERFVCEPVPRGPEALFTFGRGPVVASRRRRAAELALRCRSSLDGAPCWVSMAPLLSVFTIKTRARTTQSRTRPASGTPCQVVPKPGQSSACAHDAR
jgi:hypothetical protein